VAHAAGGCVVERGRHRARGGAGIEVQREIALRVLRRVGHQPQVREPAAGGKARIRRAAEVEAGGVDIARGHPEHLVEQRQRPADAAQRFKRVAEVLHLVGEVQRNML